SAGYGIDENTGVRYLKLNRGYGGNTVPNGSTATMKMALLSLGQSADWTLDGGYTPNNNAADLGDFYQWGRVADGHQNIVWNKDAYHINRTLPYGETPAYTSDTILYNANSLSYDPSTGQVEEGNYYGKFINPSPPWYSWYNSYNYGLWGTATGNNRATQGSLDFEWTYPANNPCPLGWRIPSSWNWWDIIDGNGSDTSFPDSKLISYFSFYNNTWQWRDDINNAAGGVIVTNKNGEKIFFSNMGWRHFENLNGRGSPSLWSSTFKNNNNIFLVITSNDDLSFLGYNIINLGLCVRCVATEAEP
ncbi:MAG: hypothetical protein LBS50_01665, partial [Prevotellaceae bacterium]|nr:hypothetical protein [Prevotellaceae bacterium]